MKKMGSQQKGSRVKYGETGGAKIPVNIWFMLDWNLTQICRNLLPLHK